MMTKFKIGEQCPINMEGEIFFRMINGSPYLILNWNNPTDKEIEDVKSGRAKCLENATFMR